MLRTMSHSVTHDDIWCNQHDLWHHSGAIFLIVFPFVSIFSLHTIMRCYHIILAPYHALGLFLVSTSLVYKDLYIISYSSV